MIRDRVVIDTGPLVAILAEDDEHHARCVEESRDLRRPFFTTWPVLTETAHLLQQEQDSIPKILGLLDNGLLQAIDLDNNAAQAIAAIARKFADLTPDLADLSLVYLANELNTEVVFTLDRRDFAIYRSGKGRPFRLIPEQF